MATEGTGAVAARELGQGWKVSPSINVGGYETVTLADIDGPGAIQHIWLTVHPTLVATAGAAHLLGRRGDALGRGAAGRLLLQWLVRALQRQLAAGGRQPGRRLQQLLGDALPQTRPHHHREPEPGRGHAASTTRSTTP